MSIFVDTGAWYAVADRSDRHHVEAARFYGQRGPAGDLVTSDLVVAETWTLLAAHLGRASALAFWEILRDLKVPILTLDPADVEAAWRIVQAFPDQAFSFTDCASFALMERLGIDSAFAFDAHFLVYRFGSGRRRAFRVYPG
ncbi:MAG: type II toxin-antitoxin system VapC family toxin [Vicinamibacterales bacterium]